MYAERGGVVVMCAILLRVREASPAAIVFDELSMSRRAIVACRRVHHPDLCFAYQGGVMAAAQRVNDN